MYDSAGFKDAGTEDDCKPDTVNSFSGLHPAIGSCLIENKQYRRKIHVFYQKCGLHLSIASDHDSHIPDRTSVEPRPFTHKEPEDVKLPSGIVNQITNLVRQVPKMMEVLCKLYFL